jgi:hypothetical protein
MNENKLKKIKLSWTFSMLKLLSNQTEGLSLNLKAENPGDVKDLMPLFHSLITKSGLVMIG